MVLHYYMDLSIAEIAETLDISSGTVKSRVHHAMRGLRAAIDADARPTIREVSQMTTNKEMERIVRSWLEPGLTTMTDDVLDPVLDQLPATPQRRPGGRRGGSPICLHSQSSRWRPPP